MQICCSINTYWLHTFELFVLYSLDESLLLWDHTWGSLTSKGLKTPAMDQSMCFWTVSHLNYGSVDYNYVSYKFIMIYNQHTIKLTVILTNYEEHGDYSHWASSICKKRRQNERCSVKDSLLLKFMRLIQIQCEFILEVDILTVWLVASGGNEKACDLSSCGCEGWS